MKKSILLTGIGLTLSLGLLAGGQNHSAQQTKTGQQAPASPIVATVNGQPITQAQLEAYRKLQAAQLPDVKLSNRQLLNELIDQTLLEQAAVKAGLDRKPEIAAKLEQARANILIEALLRDKFAHQHYSEAELKKEYDQLVAQAGQTEYKAAHILVKTRAEAEKIISELEHGANFADLAKKYSIAPSASKGGELGWFTAQTMVAPFAAAVEKLKPGEYTKTPVHTRFGWHVILLQKERKVQPPPFDQVKSRIEALLTQQAIQQYIKQLHAKAKIDIVKPPATSPAPAATSHG